MVKVEAQLRSAIRCYRAVFEAFTAMEQSGGPAADQGEEGLVEFAVQLEPLLDAAREIDRDLLTLFQDGFGVSREHLPLVREYQALLQEVSGCYDDLLARARTHRALVAAELAELRDGKKALAGYRGLAEQRGHKLSESY